MSGEHLSIDVPLKLPLTEEDREQLKDPWDGFSFEEEFYLIYDALYQMTEEFKQASLLSKIGVAPPDQLQALRENGLRGLKVATYLAEKAVMERIPEGQLMYEEADLNPEKLKWARELRQQMFNDELLTSIWAFRLDELVCHAHMDPERAARAEARAFKSSPDLFSLHMMKAQIDAEEYTHRYNVLMEMRRYLEDEYWSNDQVPPNDLFDKYFDDYNSDHSDELKFLGRRRAATYEAIKKKLDEVRPTKEGGDDGIQILPLPKLIAMLMGGNEDCGNPDCPVHGTEAKKRQAQEAKPKQSNLQSVPAQLPAAKKEEETAMTLATTDKKDTKGKKDEEEIKFQNVRVMFVDDSSSKAIQLPQGMSLKEGRYWLQKIEDEETRTFQYEFKFTGWAPLDAMWAAYRALVELHGFVHVADFQSFWGPIPPTMITIETSFGKTEQMPWGPIEVSTFSAPLVPGIVLVQGHPTLQFSATIRNNERSVVDKMMKRAVEMLKTSSIYRGKAIEVDFTVVDPNNFKFDPHKAPKFWDTSNTKVEELVLSKSVERLVKTSIWTPIRKTEEARKHKIPLRRTTLLAGAYGVGKTLAAGATAKIAEENKWTFLYLRDLTQIKQALYFAKNYQPCVIFAEDINRITSGKRDKEMDDLFNTIDGVDRKNDEVMLVFTTNNIEEIHPGMIRPGRIDTVVTVTPPDSEAVQRLIRLYGVGLIDPNADLAAVGAKLAGQIPAIIREAVERSKISAIEDNDGGELVVRAEHLDTAADQMLVHAEFLKEPEEPKPDLVVLGEAIGSVMAEGIRRSQDVDYENAKPDKEVIQEGLSNILDDAGRPNGQRQVSQPQG